MYAQRLYARTHTSGRTKSVQDAPTTNDRDCTDAKPTKHTQPFPGKGVWGFGKDAEIERPKALQDAKSTKRSCRDRKFALFFIKIDFFYK